MKSVKTWLVLFFIALTCNGCFLTKVVTVPMRVVGAVTSIVPGPGDLTHDAIDEAADAVDKLPF